MIDLPQCSFSLERPFLLNQDSRYTGTALGIDRIILRTSIYERIIIGRQALCCLCPILFHFAKVPANRETELRPIIRGRSTHMRHRFGRKS